MKTNVFISGGGIGGLTLGVKLAKCGIDVIIIEKLPGPTPVYKGELVQPKSLEIIESFDLLNKMLEHGHKLKKIDITELGESLQPLDDSVMDYGMLSGEFDYALMIHHEKFKEIVRNLGNTYKHFHYISNSICKGYENGKAVVVDGKTKKTLYYDADFFIGAEGRASVTRTSMGLKIKEETYKHHFLTVTFPRPKSFVSGKIISSYNKFLGLFPLPNNEVRSVYLIPAGDFKEIRNKPIEELHQLYLDLCPELDGYIQRITEWKKIQLMIPVSYHLSTYLKGNKVVIGDAAHAVHPMAGEGMNMAIQDADILGELLCDMYRQNELNPKHLHWYPKVRQPRVNNQISLSHLSALAYSYHFKTVSWFRRKTLVRMEKDKILHYKQMLNISGLGEWKENVHDRLVQGGFIPLRKRDISEKEKAGYVYTADDDYPWKEEGIK
ncbi:FAD-dependent monooxygenase [Jeotgalibacillus soli]|uniref:FAD-binding domain-containing protein n=1 Tax=Jeotgalibacillus soli TaxID=889306 RepID=A0A0C2VT82_9BACL|nr:FAD-dependent monooxygenase [Jeotgalibacillus soli]KIL47218.1 hypothetical protein KP78_17910 [Jeotgalibacillus soli]